MTPPCLGCWLRKESYFSHNAALPLSVEKCTRGCFEPGPTRKDLAHHEPGHGAKADGETDDVDDEAGEWDPSVGVDVDVGHLPHVEEGAQGAQREGHGHARHVQKDLASQPVDEDRGYERGQEVDDANDDGAERALNGAAGRLRNEKVPG